MSTVLLVLCALGAALWFVTELLDIRQLLYLEPGLYLAMTAYLLLAAGIWGLLPIFISGSGWLSRSAFALASLGFLLLAYLYFDLIGAPVRSAAVLSSNPLIAVALLCYIAGLVVMGICILKAGKVRQWSGAVLIVCPLLALATPLAGLPQDIFAMSGLLVSATLVYHAVLAVLTRRSTGET